MSALSSVPRRVPTSCLSLQLPMTSLRAPLACHLDLAATLLEQTPLLTQWPSLTMPSLSTSLEARRANESLFRCARALDRRITRWTARLEVAEAPVLNVASETLRFLEEVFVTEPLSRIWTAIVCEQLRRCQQLTLPAVFRAHFNRETKVRERAVRVMLAGRILTVEDALRIHRLRRLMRRATELLLRALHTRFSVHDFLDDNMSPAIEGWQTHHDWQRHWRQIASGVCVPIRLLARTQGLEAPCSESSDTVFQAMLRWLPPQALVSSVGLSFAQWSGAESLEETLPTALPWDHDGPTARPTPSLPWSRRSE